MNNLQQLPLLRTKLHRPQYDTDVVLRAQLFARLDEGLRYPVSLVSAPAGFGKSTLLSAWLQQCPVRSTWLSLDAEDSDLDIFLTYFVAAVRVLEPQACAETEALARLSVPAPIHVLAHQLVNDLDEIGQRFVLVLDDYDRIESQAVHELMSILVRRPPRALRLVLAARRDPPLPLARLRAAGLMAEVRMGDLRLQPQEVTAFWHSKLGQPLDTAAIDTLDRVIEGWPAGLRLAAISAYLSPDPQRTIASMASSSGHATEYLFREIFMHLTEDKQHCLLRIAVLDRFCGPLCDAMCAAPDDQVAGSTGSGFVEWLKSMNLFLVPLDDEGIWYRFHHLFLQLLRQQQKKRLGSADVAVLHTRASEWFAQAGLLDDALASALLIPSETLALAVIEQQRVAVLNQEDWPRMRRWLDLFSPQFYAQAPLLWLVKANVLMNQFRMAELDASLDNLAGYEAFAAEAACLRAQTCFWRGDAARSLELARIALATLAPDNIHARGNALVMMAFALQMQGNAEAGLERLMQELNGAAEHNPVLTARILLAMTGVNQAVGRLSHVIRFAQRLLAVGEHSHLVASRGWGNYLLGCAYYWRNELAQAEKHFGAVVEQPLGAHAMASMHSHFGLALTYLAQGRLDESQDVAEAVQLWAAEAGAISLARQVEAFAAHLALLQGRQAAAFAWAATYAESPPSLPLYFLENTLLILAHVCLAQGRPDQLARAGRVLSDMHRFVEETHNSLHTIDVLALEALLYDALHQPERARDALQQALALAEPARVVRPFVDLGPRMAALLHAASKSEPHAPYAAQLLAAFPYDGVQGAARSTIEQAPAGAALDPLTDRELEVLSLLAQRLSNKEIAEILVVAPVTVKTHARNLFAKLQVGGRREAVERARTLGLLRAE